MLGKEVILSKESLIFYHSAYTKFKSLNRLGNWFSPINIKEKPYTHIYNNNKPLWNDGYDFRFINNKPLKLLSIAKYKNDIVSDKLIKMIEIINKNITEEIQNYSGQDLQDLENPARKAAFKKSRAKNSSGTREQDLENPARKAAFKKSRAKNIEEPREPSETRELEGLKPSQLKPSQLKPSQLKPSQLEPSFMKGQEDDPEYILAYHLCKYSSFDGWISDSPYLGFCMLKYNALQKLKLISVSTPPCDNITMYYTSKQWSEQFI